MQRSRELSFLGLAGAGLATGGALYLVGLGDAANLVWAATTVGGVLPATWWVVDALGTGASAST